MEKTILHLDMNSFFASVEQAANPNLLGKPIAVGGGIKKGSVVAACSIEAKAFGVKNAMSTWKARKLCPHLIVVIGDMTKYIYISKIITKMMVDYTDLVEVFSIDEAFMDITKTQDRFGGAIELAKDIKRRIKERFKLTCSIGIGPNKLIAKLAGELQKPDGLVVLREKDLPTKIKDVQVKELCGVGRKTEEYLRLLGVRTIGNLNSYPREKLVKSFGMAYGEQLWQMGQCHGASEVRPYFYETQAKSIGHSYTLPKLTSNTEEINGYLLRLSEQVGRRLRRENYKGNVVCASIGTGDDKTSSHQKKIKDFINDGYQIFKVAKSLLAITNKIRFVSVSVSGLLHQLDQISLFSHVENQKKVLAAVDKVNDRFGEFTIERAAIMSTGLQGKTGMVPPKLYGLRNFKMELRGIEPLTSRMQI
ncbi:DNA polymerase IV [Candidatus Saganbacteria bacterium CG08_land_8_20_14_0_20_45_16]|uniref:DNA polymerase IV n=1 Tax=Candidatus Saganbacteria bacterium CG08_land_8_20_14_0_20_45_16 TaxID=2014293 RepID=A0A2H0XW20_UNCSA|nr:MAG: DNA polymerase IV [Candidatus Saganbacteria bacterium CG08_land_8_20_14_0_20_45_16]